DHEARLRARMHAVAARAARRAGLHTREAVHLEHALGEDGGMLRLLGVSVPAQISGKGSNLALAAAESLGASPRVHEGAGFLVRVVGAGDSLSGCLLTAKGAKIRCV